MQRLGWLLGVTAVYVAAGKLGLSLDPVSGFAALVWAPSGIALAALVRGGVSLWPAVALGALLTNLWSAAPWQAAVGIAVGNTLEAVIGTAMLVHLSGRDCTIDRLRTAFALMAVALTSTLVSASIGVGSLALMDIVDLFSAGRTFLAWWLGDVLGDLVVATLLLNWSARPRLSHGRSTLETGALILTTLGVASLAFSGETMHPLRQPYLIFFPLIWAATRFGTRASTLAVLVSSAMAIGFAVRGLGPFVTASLSDSLLGLQAFTAFVAAATLFLGTASDERSAAIEAAQSALRVRDEFLAIASHELKTPLAALSLQIGSIRRATGEHAEPGSLAAKNRDRLERARVQIERLTRLVDELLDVSRMTVGRPLLTPEPFDLSEAVQDLASRMQEQASRVGCALNVAAAEPVVGTWDKLRIEQVVSNLLSNAFKYGEGRPVEVAVEATDSCAVVRVRDRGMGIGPEDLVRIFERFERATRGTRHKGLGLGLYIARQVVDAHGGEIRVESARGEGSTFTVELPLATPAHADAAR
jgi:signal transduction histidine kinase